MTKEKNKKKILRSLAMSGFFVLFLATSFLVADKSSAALIGDYNKIATSTLTATEWNNLVRDFISNIGGRIDGPLSINKATSSSYAFDVNGSIRATSIVGAYTGTINAANVSAGNFASSTGGGNFSFPANVGIGTTNPSTILDVAGDINLNNRAVSAAGTVNSGYYVYKTGTTAYGIKLQYTSGEYGTMMFGPNQASRFLSFGKVGAALTDDNMVEYMRLDLDNGNLGVGTTTPADKLHVVGNIRHTGSMISQGANYSSSWMSFDQDVSGNSLILGAGALTVLGSGESASVMKANFPATGETLVLSSDSDVRFITNTQNGWASTTAAMTIQSLGNVGIGTTNPLQKLDISGAGASLGWRTTSGNNDFFHFTRNGGGSAVYINQVTTTQPILRLSAGSEAANTNVVLTVEGSGFVGIGTTTPASVLDVNGLIKMRNYLITKPEDVINKSYLDSALASSTASIITQVSTSSFWQGSLTGNIWSNNTGNVGIGTTTPGEKLVINSPDGTSLINQLTIRENTDRYGKYIFSQLTSGGFANQYLSLNVVNNAGTFNNTMVWSGASVGIGTTTPNAKLEVAGNLRTDTNQFYTDGSGNATFKSFYDLDNAIYKLDPSDATTALSINGSISSATGTIKMNGLGNGYVMGNLGVGTTNPGYSLDIVGRSRIQGSGTTGGGLWLSKSGTPTTNTSFIGRPSVTDGDDFTGVYSAGWNLVVKDAGNVGIGTTNPGAKLDINGNLRLSQAWPEIEFNNGGARIGNANTANTLAFYTGGGLATTSLERLRINNAGNVGISTTTPDAKLNVYGTFHVGGALNSVVVDKLSGTGNRIIMADAGGSLYATSSSVASGLPSSGIIGNTLYSNGSNWVASTSALYNNGTKAGIGNAAPSSLFSVASGVSSFNFTSGGTLYNSTNANWLRFDSTLGDSLKVTGNLYSTAGTLKIDGTGNSYVMGNMGVGIANPGAYRLNVSGNTFINGSLIVNTQTDTSPFYVTRLGNLAESLGVSTNDAVTTFQYNNDETSNRIDFKLVNTDTETGGGVGANTSTVLSILGNSSGGSVGVGTTNPGQKLDVQGGNINTSGNVTANGYLSGSEARVTNIVTNRIVKFNGSALDDSSIYDNGNVGISTTTPDAKLNVYGTFHVGGALNSVVVDKLSGTGNRIIMADAGGSLYATSSSVASGIPDHGIVGNTLYSNGSSWIASTSALYNNGTKAGIGNAAPSSLFSVASGVSSFNFTSGGTLYNSTNANWLRFDSTLGDSLKVSGNLYSTAGTLKIDGTGNSYVMGNMGVGISNPAQYKLNVSGNVFSSSNTLSVNSNSTAIEDITTNLLYNSGTTNLSNVSFSYGTKTYLGNGKYRFVNTSGGSALIRFNANLSDLVNGQTYAVGVNYENLSGGIVIDWCDSVTTGNVSAASGSGRLYGAASRATYDSTYRFFDVQLGIGGSVDLYADQVEQKTGATSFVPGARNAGDLVLSGRLFSYGAGSSYFGGNVGIGTTNPAVNLEVQGATASRIKSKTTDSASYAGIFAENDTIGHNLYLLAGGTTRSGTSFGLNNTDLMQLYSNNTPLVIGTANGHNLTLGTNNTANVTIQSGGSVGISTTTPDAKLNVYGTFHVGGALNSVVVDKLSGTGNRIIMADAGGSLYATSSSIASGLPSSGIVGNTLYSNGSSWIASTSALYNNGTKAGIGNAAPSSLFSVASGVSSFNFTSGGTLYNSTNANWLRFDSTLGDSLKVTGNLYSTAGTLKIDGTGNSYVMGNMGVGTTTPNYKLEIAGSSNVTPINYIYNGGFENGTNNVWVAQAFSADNSTVQAYSGTHSMRIYSTGWDWGAMTYPIANPAQYIGKRISFSLWMRGDSTNFLNTDYETGYPHFGTNADAFTWSTSNGSNADGFTIARFRDNAWHHYTGSFIVPVGTTNLYLSVPAWIGKNPNALNTVFTGFYVDDVIVTTGAVPEYTPLARDSNDNLLIASNVGIGTTAPGAKLHIEKNDATGNTGPNFWIKNTNPTDPAGIGYNLAWANFIAGNGAVSGQFGAGYGTGAAAPWNSGSGFYVTTRTDHPIIFATGATTAERMRITSGGNVGISTTTPDAKLNVYGTFHVGGALNSVVVDKLSGTGNRIIMADAGGSLYATSSSVASGIPSAGIAGAGSTLYSNGSSWVASTSALYNNGTKIGIGTSSPTSLLSISSGTNSLNFTSGGALFNSNSLNWLRFDSLLTDSLKVTGNLYSTAGTLKIDGTGNSYVMGSLGLGTTSPNSAKLHIYGSGTYDSVLRLTNTGPNGGDYFVLTSNDSWTAGANRLLIGAGAPSSANTKLVLDSSGNLGIGTTTPMNKLEVNGGAYFTQAITVGTPSANGHAATKNYVDTLLAGTGASLWATSSTGIYNTGLGNVGIGTTSPTNLLTIAKLDNANDATAKIISNGSTDEILHFTNSTANNTWSIGRRNTANTFEIAYNANVNGNIRSGNIMSILNTGNVGIGTTSPLAALDVYSKVKVTSGGTIYNTDSSRWLDMTGTLSDSLRVSGNIISTAGFLASDNTGLAQIRLNSAGANVAKIQNDTTGVWSLAYSSATSSALGTPVLSWNSSGNVGIGTINQNANLEISNLTGSILNLNTGDIDVQPGDVLGNLVFTSRNDGSADGDENKGKIRVEATAAYTGGPLDPSKMVFSLTNGNGVLTDYMTLLSGGNLGIGTSTPGAYKLAVNGDVNVIGNINASTYSGGAITGTINASNVSAGNFASSTGGGNFNFPIIGNVGIGITSASADSKLQVNGDVHLGGGVNRAIKFDTASAWYYYLASDSNNFRIYDAENIDFIKLFYGTGGATKYASILSTLNVVNSGNVGIGTTNPGAKLNVVSSVLGTQDITAGQFIQNINSTSVGSTSVSRGIYGKGTSGSWSGTANIYGVYGEGLSSPSGTDSGGPFNSIYGVYGTAVGNTFGAQTAIGGYFSASGANKNYGLIVGSGNVGIGTTTPNEAKLVINAGASVALKAYGDGIFTGTLQTQTGSDFAEEFATAGDLESGTVVVMSDIGYKSVKASSKSYDQTVVGIVSNNPSIIAGKVDSEHKAIVAMMGVVKVKVTNIGGSISKGDLLTTANMPGHAMKAKDFKPGTIIGKALEDLNGSLGEINVLVNLQ